MHYHKHQRVKLYRLLIMMILMYQRPLVNRKVAFFTHLGSIALIVHMPDLLQLLVIMVMRISMPTVSDIVPQSGNRKNDIFHSSQL